MRRRGGDSRHTRIIRSLVPVWEAAYVTSGGRYLPCMEWDSEKGRGVIPKAIEAHVQRWSPALTPGTSRTYAMDTAPDAVDEQRHCQQVGTSAATMPRKCGRRLSPRLIRSFLRRFPGLSLRPFLRARLRSFLLARFARIDDVPPRMPRGDAAAGRGTSLEVSPAPALACGVRLLPCGRCARCSPSTGLRRWCRR
jgi:hypothetical protein